MDLGTDISNWLNSFNICTLLRVDLLKKVKLSEIATQIAHRSILA